MSSSSDDVQAPRHSLALPTWSTHPDGGAFEEEKPAHPSAIVGTKTDVPDSKPAPQENAPAREGFGRRPDFGGAGLGAGLRGPDGPGVAR